MGSLFSAPALLLYGLALLLGFFLWKPAVRLLLFWLLVEGALRKWVWPEGHMVIYFLKDFVLIGALLRLGLRRLNATQRGLSFRLLDFSLLILVLWCAIEIFNPAIPRFMIGIIGFKTYVYYAALLYMVPEIFSSKEQLVRCLRALVICSIPLLIVGILQFFGPSDTALTRNLNWGKGEQENAVVVFGGIGALSSRVRISSTFAYLTEYSGFLSMLALLVMALFEVKSFRGRVLLLVTSILTMVNLLMTGSRGPVGLVLLCVPIFIVASGVVSFGRFLSITLRLSWVLMIGGLVIAIQFPDAFGAFLNRATFEKDVPGRLSVYWLSPVDKMEQAGLFGYGIGTTHPATEFLVQSQEEWKGMPRKYEDEVGRIILETGLIGFVVMGLFRLIFFITMWQAVRSVKEPDLRALALFGIFFHVVATLEGTLFSHVHLFLYWFFSALTLYLPQLERREHVDAGRFSGLKAYRA